MLLYVRPIPSLMFLLLTTYVTWKWVTWFKSAKTIMQDWRGYASFAGLCLATFSTALSVFLFIHATTTGGYSFYHPVELFCIRFGFLTALLGLVASIVGKGRLRLHVATISTANLLLWLVDAATQSQSGSSPLPSMWIFKFTISPTFQELVSFLTVGRRFVDNLWPPSKISSNTGGS